MQRTEKTYINRGNTRFLITLFFIQNSNEFVTEIYIFKTFFNPKISSEKEGWVRLNFVE